MNPFENDTGEMSAQRLPKKNYSSPRVVNYGDLPAITKTAANRSAVADGPSGGNMDKTA